MMVFRPLLPAAVLLAEMNPADADPARLLQAEAFSVQRAVEKRQREFAAGRILARDLLANLQGRERFDLAPLLNDADRVPMWPEGIVGSITHCGSLCAVAVAFATESGGIGLDVEPAQPLKDELAPYIVRTAEYVHLDGLPIDARALGSLLVFTMKEAVYKAIYPIRRRFLEFQDVEIVGLSIAPEAVDVVDAQDDAVSATPSWRGEFEAEVLIADAAPSGLTRIAGRYRIADGYVAASVVLPPARCA